MSGFEKCNDVIKLITRTETETEDLKSPTKKKSTKCSDTDTSAESRIKIKSLEEENFKLKAKVVDLFQNLETVKSGMVDLEKQNKELISKIEMYENTFDKDEIEKILKMSKMFQAIYESKPSQVHLVPLCDEYPEILVTPIDKSSIMEHIEGCTENKGGSTIRSILNILIPAIDIPLLKPSEIKLKYAHYVNPMFEMVSKRDSFFTVKILNEKINNMVQDSKDDKKKKKDRTKSNSNL